MYFGRVYGLQTNNDHDFLHPSYPYIATFSICHDVKIRFKTFILLVAEPDINDTKIILTDGVKFVWEKVRGASDYLLRLPETNFSKENSLLGFGTSTSVEIPYSSLPLKSDTKKRPLEVVIEVWAYGNSKIIGSGTRYINVGMYESYTSCHQKGRYHCFTGIKIMFIFNLDPLLLRMSESLQTSTAASLGGW